MLGLYVSRDAAMTDAELRALLDAHMIPLEGLTDAPAFAPENDQADFLRHAAQAVMQGLPLPMAGLKQHLGGSTALPGNVLRKYVFLQLSLAPYLRVHEGITQMDGCFLLGNDLLAAPMGENSAVDALLPPGVWTELATGERFTGRLRRIRGLNAMPVLARENSVIPIGVNDRTPSADDADRVTLHWFQPEGEAACTLHDGTAYHLKCAGDTYVACSDTVKAWHLIVHRDGEEILVK